jgi:WD40 repeat protein
MTALTVCVLVLPGCGKGDDSQPRRQKEDDGSRKKEDDASRQREDDAIRTEGNPPADGGPTPYWLHIDYLALSPDGRRLLTSYRVEHRHPSFGPLRSLSLWDTETGKELWAVCSDQWLGRIRWLADGKHFLAVAPSRKGRLSVWDAEKGVPLRDFGDGTEGEQVLAISADGKRALAAAGTELRVCAVPSGETIAYLGGANGGAIAGSLSPDGKWALASFAAYVGSDAMALWEVGKLKPARVWGRVSGWGSGFFSPDGKHIVSAVRVIHKGDEHYYSVLWERDSGKEVWRTKDDWLARQFTPDGKQLLAIRIGPSNRRALGRLDVATGKLLWSVEPTGSHSYFVFSADGRRAAASWGELSSRPGPRIIMQVWDATTGKSLRQWQVPRDPPTPPPAGKP